MTKREFLNMAVSELGGLAASTIPVKATPTKGKVGAAGVTFHWQHRDGQLWANLAAPTSGWIAVGFNDTPTLQGTRFVIAAVSHSPIRVEEHIALVPEHREVSTLGLPPAILTSHGFYQYGVSRLEFALPEVIPQSLDLRPGTNTHLMLAWSQEIDFDHHSAWRRHFNITL